MKIELARMVRGSSTTIQAVSGLFRAVSARARPEPKLGSVAPLGLAPSAPSAILSVTMRERGLLLCGIALAAACGGTVVEPGPGSDVGGFGGGIPIYPTGGTGAIEPPPEDAGVDAAPVDVPDAGLDVRSDYVEPECPDVAPLPPNEECDVFDPHATCPSGQACYPYVEYPDPNDDCAQEEYGARCVREGPGTQGDACSSVGNTCSGGYICVVTGSGTQCLQICHVFGETTCPPGLFCLQVDVNAGVGGCY